MAENTADKPETPAAPAAQQGEHEPSPEPTIVRRILNQVRHFYLVAVRQGQTDRGAAGQPRQGHGQGRDRRQSVGIGRAGDHEDILWLSGRLRHDAERRRRASQGDLHVARGERHRGDQGNVKIQDIGSGFIVHEGFNRTELARWIQSHLPIGMVVFVCDLAGYKVAMHGEGEAQTGKIIIGTTMSPRAFYGWLTKIPPATKGVTHPLVASKTDFSVSVSKAHCVEKGSSMPRQRHSLREPVPPPQ